MRNSLKKLHLENGMISSMDYAIFGKFKALKELYIGENVLQDIFSCDSILQHLPQLTKFSVEGFQPNDDMEPMDDERGTNPNFKHSNIKSLEIRAFQEWGDLEWDYIMEKFPELKHLTLFGTIKPSESGDTVSSARMKLFIQHTMKIKHVFISFKGFPIADQLMDMYPIYQDDIHQGDGCEL